jgi:hypothetical protein
MILLVCILLATAKSSQNMQSKNKVHDLKTIITLSMRKDILIQKLSN